MLNDQQWTSVGFDFRTTGAGHGGVYSFSSDGQYAVGWDDSRPAVWKYNSDFEGDLTNPSDYAYLRGLGITQVNGVVNPIGYFSAISGDAKVAVGVVQPQEDPDTFYGVIYHSATGQWVDGDENKHLTLLNTSLYDISADGTRAVGVLEENDNGTSTYNAIVQDIVQDIVLEGGELPPRTILPTVANASFNTAEAISQDGLYIAGYTIASPMEPSKPVLWSYNPGEDQWDFEELTVPVGYFEAAASTVSVHNGRVFVGGSVVKDEKNNSNGHDILPFLWVKGQEGLVVAMNPQNTSFSIYDGLARQQDALRVMGQTLDFAVNNRQMQQNYAPVSYSKSNHGSLSYKVKSTIYHQRRLSPMIVLDSIALMPATKSCQTSFSVKVAQALKDDRSHHVNYPALKERAS